jgi:hypothetical protein
MEKARDLVITATYGFLGISVVTVLPGFATFSSTVALLDFILEGIKCFSTSLKKSKIFTSFSWPTNK